MKYKQIHSKREWLNPKESWDSGSITSMVSVDEGGIECDISIWDCSRKISLTFSAYSEKDANQRAKKLNMLINHLQEVKKALGKAYTITVGGEGFDG